MAKEMCAECGDELLEDGACPSCGPEKEKESEDEKDEDESGE